MPAKKRKKKAKVELSSKAVHQFESALRNGLIASGAVMAAENVKTPLKRSVKIKLDPATVARLSEILRHGLSSATAVANDEIGRRLDKMTGQVKGQVKSPRAAK